MNEVATTHAVARKHAGTHGRLAPVIENDVCIGCGACAAVNDSDYSVVLDERGQFVAQKGGQAVAPVAAERVCPFSPVALDEDALGRSLFSANGATYHGQIGYHRASYLGHVQEGEFRALGSSGGMGKWILHEMLRLGLVDTVIQVGARTPDAASEQLYGYSIFHRPEDVLKGSKSVYYPIEMSRVLAYVRENPGRYAITGVPCFIKALRLLAREEPVFRERIVFHVGLICGHLKSSRYGDMIGWQFGIEPGRLAAIDFRRKLPGTSANQKGVAVSSLDPSVPDPEPDIVQHLFGTNYNHGFFQYNACNYCDDVVGETADISVGDAWLPGYMEDGRGTNAVVVRHPMLHDLVERGIAEGRLALTAVSADTIAESQAGGFRQRREGLAYRLYLARRSGAWHPPKRVAPKKNHVGRRRRRIYELRMEMSARSHEAFARAISAGDFEVFRRAMQPLVEENAHLYRPSFFQRLVRAVRRRMGRR